MFRLFKKNYAYPELKWPSYARELTEEEKLLVNGGGGTMSPEDQQAMAEAGRRGDVETQNAIRAKYESNTPTTPANPTQPVTATTTVTTPQPVNSGTADISPADGGIGSSNSPESSGGSSSGGSNGNNSPKPSITPQISTPVSQQDHNLKAGLSHVEDYKKAARKTLGIRGSSVTGSSFKGKEVPEVSAQNVTLTGRNLTGRGFPSSTDGFRPVEVKSGSPGSLARRGYPSTTEGYPNAYNTIEKKPLMGESIYSEYYIRKNVPEQYQEAAIRAMHEEEKRGLYGSPTDSKRMTTRVGVKTKYQDRHTGIDIGALKKDENDIPIKGDPIYATADGKVIDFRYTENSGSTLLELSLPGTKDRAIYQHADFIVKPGDEVKRGQIIGYMDSINVGANQVHLHYEIRHNGIYALSEGGVLVDPTLHMPGTYYFDKNQ